MTSTAPVVFRAPPLTIVATSTPQKDWPPERWAEHYQLYEADGNALLTRDRVPLFRALLLTGGEIEMIGDPHDVGRRYIERNFEG